MHFWVVALALIGLLLWAATTFSSRRRHQNKRAQGTTPLDKIEQLKEAVSTSIEIIREKGPSQGLSRSESPVRYDLSNTKVLFTKAEAEDTFGEKTWQRVAYNDFAETITGKGANKNTFPCVYATMGYRANDHRYVFCESHDLSAPRNVRVIGAALSEYLKLAPSLGPNTSLVIMGAPAEKILAVADYTAQFWNLLRGLRIRDEHSWPESVPSSTHDSHWTFCFDDQAIFPVSLTPAHELRWSRHASVPLVALQPKWVIDQLLATPEKRAAAEGKVRKLLELYDDIEISPHLTSYGAEGSSEIRQLALADDNESLAEAPYADFDI